MKLLLAIALACPIAARAAEPFLWTDRSEGRLQLAEGERPVLTYNYGPQLKEGVKEEFRRACYFHPIHDLDGTILTDDFPKDHLHHRGLFWAWPEVVVGGVTHDPWACVGIQQRFRRWIARETSGDHALLGVENGWFLADAPVVRERLEARIGRADARGRAIDITLTLEAERDPVTLAGRRKDAKGYGGFTLRFAPRRDAAITLPSGLTTEDAVQTRAAWADFSARFGAGDAISGIAIFDHPGNPAHPTTWLTRHYGVLNPTWPALQPTAIAPGKPVTLRYRVWIHRGDCRSGQVPETQAAWALANAPGRTGD